MQPKQLFSDIVFELTKKIVSLRTGELARLRRMSPDGPGEPEFWNLAVRHEFANDPKYMQLVKLLALLTPKGKPSSGKVLHTAGRALGKALFETDYSETRLMRFIALPLDKRGNALERMVRWLAAKGGGEGVNCIDIACLLFSADVKHTRKLARDFYQAQFMNEKNASDQTTKGAP